MKNGKTPIIYIEWMDSHSNHSWYTNEEMDQWAKGVWYCNDVGYLVRETKMQLVLAQRHEPAGNGTASEKEQWGGLHKIPKTWIRNRRLLGWLNSDGSIISPPIPTRKKRP